MKNGGNDLYEKFFYLIAAYTGIIITYFFGGWNDALQFLTFLIIADFITGILASFMEGKDDPHNPNKGISSSKSYWGIFKKVLMFLVIAVLHRLDLLLGIESSVSLMVGGIYFYLANEIISLTENLGRAGVPIPNQLKSGISALKKKAGVQDEIPIREEGKPLDQPSSSIVRNQIEEEDQAQAIEEQRIEEQREEEA